MMNISASTALKTMGKVSPSSHLTPESLKKLSTLLKVLAPLPLYHIIHRDVFIYFQDGVVRCEKISLYCAAFIRQISWNEVSFRRLCGLLNISTSAPGLFLQHNMSELKNVMPMREKYLEPKSAVSSEGASEMTGTRN